MKQQVRRKSSPGEDTPPIMHAVTIEGDDSRAQGGVIALERGLRILGAFDQRTPVMTLGGLAIRTGLHKSTILRLMISLERLNFISRDEEGLYRIGAQAWRVGILFDRELNVQQVLPPILEALCAKIKESVSFWVPFEGTPLSRLCLARAETSGSVRVHTPIGSVLPLDAGGACGRAMRAFVDPTHREDDRIRAEGVCTAWAERDPELCGAAAPVFGVDGKAVGVLSVSAPISRRNRAWLESIKPVVLETAGELTRSLGFEHVQTRTHI